MTEGQGMSKAAWMIFAVALIAAASGCAPTQGSVSASAGTGGYGSSSASPESFDALTDVYQTGRASARRNF